MVRLTAVLAVVLVICLVGLVAWLRSSWGNQWMRGQVESLVQSSMKEGRIELGALETDLITGAELRDVKLFDTDGREVLTVKRADVDLAPWDLLRWTLHLQSVVLEGVDVDLRQREDGNFEILHLFDLVEGEPNPEGGAPFDALPLAIVVDHFEIVDSAISVCLGDDPAEDFTVAVEHLGLTASASGLSGGDRLTVPDLVIGAELVSPDPGPVVVTGSLDLTWIGADNLDLDVQVVDLFAGVDGRVGDLDADLDADLDVQVRGAELAMVGRIARFEGLEGAWEGTVTVDGGWTDLDVTANMNGMGDTEGRVSATVGVDLFAEGGPDWDIDVGLRGVRVDQAYPGLGAEARVQGDLHLAGAGVTFPDGIRAEGTFAGETQEVLGYRIDKVGLGIGLVDGVVTVRDLDVVTAPATLGGGATLNLVTGRATADVSGPIRLAELSMFGVPDLGGTGWLSVRATSDVLAETLGIDANGSVDLSQVTWQGGTVGATRVRADWRGDVSPDGVDVVASATISGASAFGAEVDEVRLTGIEASSTLDLAVRANGRVGIVGARYGDQLGLRDGGGTWGVVADLTPEEGEGNELVPFPLTVDTDLVLGAHQALAGRVVGESGDLFLHLDRTALAFGVGSVGDGREILDTRGRIDLMSLAGRLDHLRAQPTHRQSWSDDGETKFQVDLRHLGVRGLHLALSGGPLGLIAVDGDFLLDGPLDGRVEIDDLQLDVVAELVPDLAPGLAGTLDVDAVVEGTAHAIEAHGDLAVSDLYVDGAVGFVTVVGGFEAAQDRIGVGLDVTVGRDAPLARIDGGIPFTLDLAAPWVDPGGRLDLTIDLHPGGVDRIEWLTAPLELDVPWPEGRYSGRVVIGGTPRSPTVDVAAVAEVAVPGWQETGRMEIRAGRRGDRLRWWVQLREGWALRGSVTGTASTKVDSVLSWLLEGTPAPELADLDLYVDRIDGAVSLAGIPARSLLAVTGQTLDVDASVHGALRLGGSATRPTASGTVFLEGARLGVNEVDVAEVTLRPVEDGYRLVADLEFADRVVETPRRRRKKKRVPIVEAGGLRVEGTIPVSVDLGRDVADWVTGEFDLQLSGDGLPLALASVVYPRLSEVRGLLKVEGAVSGTLTEPEARVVASISPDATLVIDELGIRVQDIELDATVDRRHIELTRFAANSRSRKTYFTLLGRDGVRIAGKEREKSFAAHGSASLAGWVPEGVTLQLAAKDALVAGKPDLFAIVDADLRVTGDWPALHTAGTVHVPRTYVFEDLASLFDAGSLSVDPSMTVHRGGVPTRSRRKADPFYKDFTADVTVTLGRDVEGRVLVAVLDDFGAFGSTITRADAEARLTGSIRATLAGGVPVLNGEVTVISCTAKVAASTFECAPGSRVLFADDLLEPDVDITAVMRFADGTVELHATGTPFAPKVEFRSEEFPDETAIFMALITGRSPSQLSTEQGQAALASALSLALNSLMAGVNLGDVDFDPIEGTLEIGVLVPGLDNVRVAPRWKFTKLELNENRFSLGVEVAILPKLILEGAWGDQRSWADLLWEFRF